MNPTLLTSELDGIDTIATGNTSRTRVRTFRISVGIAFLACSRAGTSIAGSLCAGGV